MSHRADAKEPRWRAGAQANTEVAAGAASRGARRTPRQHGGIHDQPRKPRAVTTHNRSNYMRYLSPGASGSDDYAHVCDQCGIDDGRPFLMWDNPDFDLCFECLGFLYKRFIDHETGGGPVKVVRKVVSEKIRDAVFDKDGGRCVRCGSNEDLCLDHIVPFSRGGRTDIDNLQTLCRKCNSSKGSRSMESE